MNKYSHGFFIESIYLRAPFCDANTHTDAEQRKKQNKTGTWRQKLTAVHENMAPRVRMRTAHSFPNRSYSLMNSPQEHTKEGIAWSSGSIQINYTQGLVCRELCVQECLSLVQQVYSSSETWQASLCWGEAVPSARQHIPVWIRSDIFMTTHGCFHSNWAFQFQPKKGGGDPFKRQTGLRHCQGAHYSGVVPIKIILIIVAATKGSCHTLKSDASQVLICVFTAPEQKLSLLPNY